MENNLTLFNEALVQNKYSECYQILDSLTDEQYNDVTVSSCVEKGLLPIILLIQKGIVQNSVKDLLDASTLLNIMMGFVEGAAETAFYLARLASDLCPENILLKENLFSYRFKFKEEYIGKSMKQIADEILSIDPSHKEALFVKGLIEQNLPLSSRV
jgi:hypothetical protein